MQRTYEATIGFRLSLNYSSFIEMIIFKSSAAAHQPNCSIFTVSPSGACQQCVRQTDLLVCTQRHVLLPPRHSNEVHKSLSKAQSARSETHARQESSGGNSIAHNNDSMAHTVTEWSKRDGDHNSNEQTQYGTKKLRKSATL